VLGLEDELSEGSLEGLMLGVLEGEKLRVEDGSLDGARLGPLEGKPLGIPEEPTKDTAVGQ